MSSLAKPHSMFDLKSHTSITDSSSLLNPLSRNTNRDSIAQGETNRMELEKLVEQINQDLSTSQQTTLAQSPEDARAFVVEFLAEQSNKSKSKVTVGQSDTDDSSKPVSCVISDDETLEMILKAEVKDSPVTDLDKDTASENSILTAHDSLTEKQTQDSETITDNQPTKINTQATTTTTASAADKTLNDILDQLEQQIAEVNREENNIEESSGDHPVPDPSKLSYLFLSNTAF